MLWEVEMVSKHADPEIGRVTQEIAMLYGPEGAGAVASTARTTPDRRSTDRDPNCIDSARLVASAGGRVDPLQLGQSRDGPRGGWELRDYSSRLFERNVTSTAWATAQFRGFRNAKGEEISGTFHRS